MQTIDNTVTVYMHTIVLFVIPRILYMPTRHSCQLHTQNVSPRLMAPSRLLRQLANTSITKDPEVGAPTWHIIKHPPPHGHYRHHPPPQSSPSASHLIPFTTTSSSTTITTIIATITATTIYYPSSLTATLLGVQGVGVKWTLGGDKSDSQGGCQRHKATWSACLIVQP